MCAYVNDYICDAVERTSYLFDTLCFGLALANVRFLWTIGRDIYSFIFIIHFVSFAMDIAVF